MSTPKTRKLDLEALRGVAAIAGFDLPEERLKTIEPHLQTLMQSLRALDEMDLQDVEPATIFSVSQE